MIVQMTDAQLEDYSERLIKRTISEVLGNKASEFIYRPEMVRVIGGRRPFERAVRLGKIVIMQDGEGIRPRVYADRKKFEAYIDLIKRDAKILNKQS